MTSTFKNQHLSVSRLKLYEQCARAFYLKYVDKGPTVPGGDAAMFGVVLHAALESFFAWVIAEEFTGPLPVERLIEAYKQAWRDNALVGVGLYQEGLDILRTYASSHPPVDHLTILAVEQEFNITVEGFTINGYIDRIDKVDETCVRIVDYKSNRALFTKGDLETDLQVSVYALAARSLYPWATRVELVFHMLRFDTRQEAVRDAQTIDDAAGYVGAIGRRSESDTEWVARPNENCGYCDHRSRCDAYKAIVSGSAPSPTVTDPNDIDAVVREREVVAKLAKMLYARKEELDRVLKRKLAEDGEFVAGGVRVRQIQAYDTAYPRVSTVQAFAKMGLPAAEVERRIVVVDPKAVAALRDEIAKTGTTAQAHMVKATIDALAVKTPATPRLDVRAEKTPKSVASLATSDKKREIP